MSKYEVLRQHDGDKQYWQGDVRELDDVDAKQLVDLGVLRKARAASVDAAAKSERAPSNKMMPAPANKSAPKD